MNNQLQTNSDKRCKLTQEMKLSLAELLSKTPLDYGYCSESWTGVILANYIEKKFNTSITCRTIQRFLKESNYKRNDIKIIDNNFKLWLKETVSRNLFDIWFFGEIFIKKEILMKNYSNGKALMTTNKGAIVAYNYITKENIFEIGNANNENNLYTFLTKVIAGSKSEKKKLFLMSDSPLHKILFKNMLLDEQFSGQTMIKFIYLHSERLNPILELKNLIDEYKNRVDGIRKNDIIPNRNIADVKKIIRDYKQSEW